MASIVTGTVVASIWGYLSGGPGGLWDILPATPGFIIATPVAVAVTYLTAPPSREVLAVFDQVNPPREALGPSAAD